MTSFSRDGQRTAEWRYYLASLRRLALNLLRKEKTKKRGLRGKQLNVAWDHTCLLG